MDNCSTYVAMDTHKKRHNVAVLDLGTGEIRQFSVKNTGKDIAKMVKSIARQAPAAVKFCYEAACTEVFPYDNATNEKQAENILTKVVPYQGGLRFSPPIRRGKPHLTHTSPYPNIEHNLRHYRADYDYCRV